MDLNRFTTKAQQAIQEAQGSALERSHPRIELEHLYAGLLQDREVGGSDGDSIREGRTAAGTVCAVVISGHRRPDSSRISINVETSSTPTGTSGSAGSVTRTVMPTCCSASTRATMLGFTSISPPGSSSSTSN